MQTLVLKTWKANSEPIDADGNYVFIHGRSAGLLAWLLSLLKIDPTTWIKVSPDRIEFARTSLAGSDVRIIPLANVCSAYYGYFKPWKAALALFAAFFSAGIVASQTSYGGQALMIFLLFFVLGTLLAIAYYFFKRSLTLGFVEFSGLANGIRFQRSLIENTDINETQAAYICQLVQAMIQERAKTAAK